MDLSLAILIVLAAGFAGAAVGVSHGLARVWLPGTFLVAAAQAAAITYLTLVRDLGRARAGQAAAAAGLVIGTAFALVSYLAVMALIGAAGVYVVLRLRLRIRPALLVMGGTLGTLLAGSAAVFAVALSSM
jgi:hypothetical protein